MAEGMQQSVAARPLAEEFVEFADAAYRTGLPEPVMEAAGNQLIDSLGVALAAVGEETVGAVRQLVDAWAGAPVARALGHPDRVPAAHAALLGGTLAHALDFDDTHLPSVLHPSASVVPASLAVADELDAPLDRVLRAVALGNELTVRLGMVGYDDEERDSIYFARGFHATSICGAVGAALSAGLLADLPAPALLDAVGIASSLGSGLLEANRTGGTVKRLHCGWAALAGVSATTLAGNGVTGPPTVLEGRFGFIQAFCGDRARPEWVTRDLGQHWEMTRIGFKPYPTNGFTHAVIDAALRLREQGHRLDDIRSVEIFLPEPVLRTVAQPIEEKARPRSPYNARFSAPFVFALALSGGGGLGIGVDDFTEGALRDERLLALAGRTEVSSDPRCDRSFPEEVPARVVARLVDGGVVEEFVERRRGSVGNPLGASELRDKFCSNASRTLGADAAEDLHRRIVGAPASTRASDILDASQVGAR